METIPGMLRMPVATVHQVIEAGTHDLQDALALVLNGRTSLPLTWESLSTLSPQQARLLSSVGLAMAVRFQLQSWMETNVSANGLPITKIGQYSLRGHAILSQFVEAMDMVDTMAMDCLETN